jgi:PAS domain S-box-containing protein
MKEIDCSSGLTLSDRVDQALDAAGLAWWELDCASGRLRSSRAHAAMFALDPDAGLRWHDVVAAARPPHADAVAQAMQNLLADRTADYHVRYRIESRGATLWVQDTGRVTAREPDGRPATVTGVAQDITSQARLESALRKAGDRAAMLFRHHSAPMLIVDPTTGRIEDANDAAVAFYGWTLEEMRRLHVHDINGLSREAAIDVMAVVTTGHQDRYEFRHRLADGSVRDVEVFSNPIDLDGRIRLHSIVHDITEHKRAETERATSERNLVHAEEFARFGHWAFSLDERVMHASAGAMRIYGVDRPHVSLERAQASVVAADRPRLDAALQALIAEGVPYDIEFEIKRPSDDAIVAVHSRAEFDPTTRRVFGVIQDITERKRSETVREALIEQLRKALDQIKTLDGIVPICASCKKIRDDKGYWEQVEAYVSRHTDARFSHGICPDCAARLYPEL